MGAHATLDAAGTMTLSAFVGRADGSVWLRDTLTMTGARRDARGARRAGRPSGSSPPGAGEVLGR